MDELKIKFNRYILGDHGELSFRKKRGLQKEIFRIETDSLKEEDHKYGFKG